MTDLPAHMHFRKEKVCLCSWLLLAQARHTSCPVRSNGPYRVIRVHKNDVEVRLVGQPQATTIRVALNHVRRYPSGVPDTFWPSKGDRQRVET